MSGWSEEKPEEPGFYTVLLERGCPAFAELLDDGSYNVYFFLPLSLDIDVEYWGPEVKFPELPPEDGWWEVYSPSLAGCFVRYVKDGSVYAGQRNGEGFRCVGDWISQHYDWSRSTRLVPA